MAYATVEITSVRKAFGPTVALGGCSLKAYAGEVHAIIGGNGSGKSTLAKVISGVLIPDSGQVSILGGTATSPYEARKLGIANVFQEVLVADGCSVLDNLYLGADGLFGLAVNREDRLAEAGLMLRELLGFDLDLNAPVGDLPLSVKQWVTIARGLLSNPRVLILDESSAALDFDATERLFRKMRQLKATGASILIVTHRIAELVRIADRATVLRDGVDVGCLERHEITEHRILDLIAGPERTRAEVGLSVPQRQSSAPLLRIENARVWADAAPVNFTLFPGEIVGVTGLDGHGQVEFVRAIAGVQPLISGSITMLAGKTSNAIADLQSARDTKISYVSGDRNKEGIFANLSIFENMMLPVYREYRAGGILNLVNRSKLSPVFEWESGKLAVRMGSRDNAITSLSGGNQQKVLIARAFAEKPVVLVLNDPARGIDVGAKLDLYRNLRDFAAKGGSVVFLSSEIEEFLHLCTRVHVFRNGTIASDFEPPYDGNVILNAMFGRKASAATGAEGEMPRQVEPSRPASGFHTGRPEPRAIVGGTNPQPYAAPTAPFTLHCPDIAPGQIIPSRFTEENIRSPRVEWANPPPGTRSFALSITDPDLPAEFNFPRSFAHWLVHDIAPDIRALPEGASQTALMPAGAQELDSDFVTFHIPGFGRGYGGPWPPDREHRYVFTLYALQADHLALAQDADLTAFSAAVLPVTIETASFTARYGPARKPLPSSQQTFSIAEMTGG